MCVMFGEGGKGFRVQLKALCHSFAAVVEHTTALSWLPGSLPIQLQMRSDFEGWRLLNSLSVTCILPAHLKGAVYRS